MAEAHGRKICIVGLGYVGLPLAIAFGRRGHVYGYDTSEKRISELMRGFDRNGELDGSRIREAQINFTTDPAVISESDFIIAAIPTPVDEGKRPDMRMLEDASRTIGRHLRKGSIVVFESTVYPGATEEICIPLIEKESGLKHIRDFKSGYSPERINPGDREHTVESIVKIVSGCDAGALDTIAAVYGSVIRAGVYRAPSIRVAEAAKIIENVQRDINIALMNELKIILDCMGIDIGEVLKAAGTKWNFIGFHPGLVGGHCIGVDPYYLAYKSEVMGHHPEMILAGRRINDDMPKYVASLIVKDMIRKEIRFGGSKVLVLGATFKPNVKDLRNSKVEDIISELKARGCTVDIHDPVVDDRKEIFGCRNISREELESGKYDYVILAVKHDKLRDAGKRSDFVVL